MGQQHGNTSSEFTPKSYWSPFRWFKRAVVREKKFGPVEYPASSQEDINKMVHRLRSRTFTTPLYSSKYLVMGGFAIACLALAAVTVDYGRFEEKMAAKKIIASSDQQLARQTREDFYAEQHTRPRGNKDFSR